MKGGEEGDLGPRRDNSLLFVAVRGIPSKHYFFFQAKKKKSLISRQITRRVL